MTKPLYNSIFISNRVYLRASKNSALCQAGPASLFHNPEDRPFWSRPTTGTVSRTGRMRRWRHAVVVLVVLIAIVLVGVVIFVVLGKARGWI